MLDHFSPKRPEEIAVDIEQLRMFTDGDREEEKALAKLFSEQSDELLTILQKSIAQDKQEAWKFAAHCFKGSSGNLGAMQLYHLCKDAEMHFEDEEHKKIEMLAAIKSEIRRVDTFFQR